MKSRFLKRLVCGLLTASLVMLPCRPSPAPVPIYLGLALKVCFGGVIVGTATILYRCEQPHYLVRYQIDDEDPWWGVSQASAATLAKLGGRRCQGPGDPKELYQRAWENNHSQVGFPMHGCSALGSPLPPASRTNYSIVSVQHSYNGGNLWRNAGSILVAPGESNWAICLLGPTGTNGMTAAELWMVAECDTVIPNGLPVANEIKDYRVRGFVYVLPPEIVSVNRSKAGRETN